MGRGRERIKDGRHIGLDFYDLLIEPIMGINGSYVMSTLPLNGRTINMKRRFQTDNFRMLRDPNANRFARRQGQ
jgi:hypothetical protein